MTVSARWYANGLKNFIAGNVDFDANTIKFALLTSSYSPALDSDQYFDAIDGNECVGTGYSAGGTTLANKAITVVDDSSLTAHATTTAYVVGDVRRPSAANGHVYLCVVAGTSGGSAPTWPTNLRETVTDGTVTWAEAGSSVLTIDNTADIEWTSINLTASAARYGVLYKTGTAGVSDYLLFHYDFGSDQAPNGTFTLTPATLGLALGFIDY